MIGYTIPDNRDRGTSFSSKSSRPWQDIALAKIPTSRNKLPIIMVVGMLAIGLTDRDRH